MICGLDIGGTKTESAVFDDVWNRAHGRRVATPTDDYGRFIASARELVREAEEKSASVEAVGVALPGIRDRLGRSFSVNVPCINGRNVFDDLGRVLNRPIAVINDGRAFALSEATLGAGHGKDPMAGVILGTGAFGGYCVGGRVQDGKDGIAGEWGHVGISAPVRERHGLPLFPCGCGRSGCIETYVSGRGMARIHAEVGASRLAAAEIVDGMRAGEASCRRAFDIWLDCVASCFGQLILQINPEIIVLGGGLSKIDELYSLLPSALSKYLFEGIPPPEIVPARFGDAGGARGAAIYAAQRHGSTGPQANPRSPR